MKVTLVGTGCGSIGTMTASAIYALEHADLIIGAPRLIEGFPKSWGGERKPAVSSTDIMDIIRRFRETDPDIPWNGAELSEETENTVSVAFSGDTGFYSGARNLIPLLKEEDVKVEILPGISSLQLLASRLELSWQDWKLVSAHGTECDASREIDSDRHTFFLTGGSLGPSELCMQICEAGFENLQVAVAERLSYDDERITIGGARDFTGGDFDNLSVLLVWPTGIRKADGEADLQMPAQEPVYEVPQMEVPGEELQLQDVNQLFEDPESRLLAAVDEDRYAPAEEMRDTREIGRSQEEESALWQVLRPGLPDSAFIRGDVPMTKREIRAIISGHMQIGEDDILWDVGAGTGSVSVEMALQAVRGRVYAVEKDPEGIMLIQQNREYFGLENIETVHGQAPEALRDLPAPDKVFVGGSGGTMREIIETALDRNPSALICVTAILIETAAETMAIMDYLGMDMEVSQISVSSARKASGKHMMIAGNPIFVITGMMAQEPDPGYVQEPDAGYVQEPAPGYEMEVPLEEYLEEGNDEY